jgi:diguanylate cyclase (GGDEF)-like protein
MDDDDVVATLESVASKTASRLALVRSVAPAASVRHDRSTGALDRSTTEQRILDLGRDLVPFSLAQADVDHFAAYVAAHGSGAAETAVRLLARTLQDVLRPSDIVGRFGDDEFVVVLPHASEGQAQRALERVREHLALSFTDVAVPPFTVSFGVVESSFGQTLDELLVAADVAVSLAKDLGRNRVVVSGEQLLDPLAVDGDE